MVRRRASLILTRSLELNVKSSREDIHWITVCIVFGIGDKLVIDSKVNILCYRCITVHFDDAFWGVIRQFTDSAHSIRSD